VGERKGGIRQSPQKIIHKGRRSIEELPLATQSGYFTAVMR
jgi:hypothetical protein